MIHGNDLAPHGIGGGVLNDAKIKAAKPRERAYRLSDTGQLYLEVTPAGGKHWRQNYTFGRSAKDPTKPAQKTLAHGSYPLVSLVEARGRRDEAKKLLAEGKDPAVAKREAVKVRTVIAANTFRIVAERWFTLKSGWSLPKYRAWRKAHPKGRWTKDHAAIWIDHPEGTWNPRHSDKVLSSLEEYVFPAIGDTPIDDVDAPTLLDLLQAVETKGVIETAHRVRQRISAVFVYGIAAGVAKADPAASLGRALKPKPRVIPQPSIVDGIEEYDEQLRLMRQLMIDCEALRSRATTKLALRFLALTAVRSNELSGARWCELEDLEPRFGLVKGVRVQINQPTWRIPADRMKGDEDRKAEVRGDHLVPLATQALEVIAVLRRLTGRYDLMFPTDRHVHQPLSEGTIRDVLIRAGYYKRHVPHGFRAAFSTIMNERPKAEGGRHDGDRAIVDLMLAHVPKEKVEGAYNRAAYMPRRRELAQQWADLLLADMWPPEIHVGQPMRWAATGQGKPEWDM